MFARNRVSERREETKVTVHIWRASDFWGGLYRHITDRQMYCIGHVALQTYDHADPQNPGQTLPGKFINFLPPADMTTILNVHFGKTPCQEASYQYRDNAEKFFELDKPSISMDLYSLNPRAIEAMYDLLRARDQEFKWSAYSIPFFRSNYMSSTKLALWLLASGVEGGLQLPVHISIPVLREINTLLEKIKKLLCEDGIRIDPNITLAQIKEIALTRTGEVAELLTSVISTLANFAAISSNECEQLVTYLHGLENPHENQEAVPQDRDDAALNM